MVVTRSFHSGGNGESPKSKLSFAGWGDFLCMSGRLDSFTVCSLCITRTTTLTSANIVLDGKTISCSVSFFNTTGKRQGCFFGRLTKLAETKRPLGKEEVNGCSIMAYLSE